MRVSVGKYNLFGAPDWHTRSGDITYFCGHWWLYLKWAGIKWLGIKNLRADGGDCCCRGFFIGDSSAGACGHRHLQPILEQF
jgi:hypothetical protein